jgi:hypothetical protein
MFPSLSIVLFLLAACGLAVAKEVPLRAKPLSATDPPSLGGRERREFFEVPYMSHRERTAWLGM